MARNTEPKCKQCRREGEKLYLKGEKCLGPKCPVTRRAFPPGQHGPTSRAKITPFGVQLREKQKAKRIYGMMERQFEGYFTKAASRQGDTGVFLKQFLEMRLDNSAYRFGFARSRAQARQFVGHGMFQVNGKDVNIPSYQCKAGDVVMLREKAQKQARIQQALQIRSQIGFPDWVEVDEKKFSGVLKALPEREDILPDINESLVVELYSK